MKYEYNEILYNVYILIYFFYVLKFQKDGAWQKNHLELSSKDERSTRGNMVPASYKPPRKDKDITVADLLKEVLLWKLIQFPL
jgi:hypothetical protein